MIEIDHVFMFVESEFEAEVRAEALGLVETYRRTHKGQGTSNVCFCFDNCFLEMIWIDDASAVRSKPISRTKLYERSQWQVLQTCRFGIAWRGELLKSGINFWPFKPPYLPPNLEVLISTDTDDEKQPMLFTFPGTVAPAKWALERRKDLQHRSGFGSVTSIELTMPLNIKACATLKWLEAQTILTLRKGSTTNYSMTMSINDLNDNPTKYLDLT